MRDFRLKPPDGSAENDEARRDRAEATLLGWEIEEATAEYLAASGHSALAIVFATLILLVAMTLIVTVGMRSGLIVLGAGLLLAPTAWRWCRDAFQARRTMRRLEAESERLLEQQRQRDLDSGAG